MTLKKAGSPKARLIVANLLARERFAAKLLKETLGAEDKNSEAYRWMLNTRSANWAEAHNAAETSRRILYDHEI